MFRSAVRVCALVALGLAVSPSVFAQEMPQSSAAPGYRPIDGSSPLTPRTAPPGIHGASSDEEDEAGPPYVDLAQAQGLDIGLFVGFAALAMVGFFRKSERAQVATLVAASRYLGVYKSQMISIVNIFGLLG